MTFDFTAVANSESETLVLGGKMLVRVHAVGIDEGGASITVEIVDDASPGRIPTPPSSAVAPSRAGT